MDPYTKFGCHNFNEGFFFPHVEYYVFVTSDHLINHVWGGTNIMDIGLNSVRH